ncbi:MAG: magnesium chelatase subunit H [Pseudomonadota bacterium]
MPKRTSAAKTKATAKGQPPLRFVIVTLDSHLGGAVEHARECFVREGLNITLRMHCAAEWGDDSEALARCHEDIASADILVVNMLFLEEHIQAVLPQLKARRDECAAMVCSMAAGEVTKLTRMGRFTMDGSAKGPMALLKKLKPKKTANNSSAGASQMSMLRRLPAILRFIPGTAQDVRAYFLTLQYWLAGSNDNVVEMVRFLVGRYADGAHRKLRGKVKSEAPVHYPDVGVYHPRLKGRMGEDGGALPSPDSPRGTVGLLVLRSYVLAGNADHYDGVIEALEAKGLRVVPAFASGLDARPAIEQFFLDPQGNSTVDTVVSLTGFSLVGGPAYNDADAAAKILGRLDVPYIACHPVEFQTLDQWESSARGLQPVEATMMVAIPELDGATSPMLFGGRRELEGGRDRAMSVHPERAERLADRVARMVALRRTERAQRRVAIVLFNFPPNGGSVGTAAYLSVFESLHATLARLKKAGYEVEVPDSVDTLRNAVIEGNRTRFGTDANVLDHVSVDDHVRREPWLDEIESQWGTAPGKHQTDGRSLFVLGARFGNVAVAVQPAFGYEGDPMRLLFEGGFAPTHAFAAFYRYLREDFAAHACLHFGTHGALEFMPGKQTGMSDQCWPERLLGALPNFYLYAANNPSEGTIAKRRAAATLVSYLTPPVQHAGLYQGLLDLRESVDTWRSLAPDERVGREDLPALIQAQAAALDLAEEAPAWEAPAEHIDTLAGRMLELEYTLIPHGMHVVGADPTAAERVDWLAAVADATHGFTPPLEALETLTCGGDAEAAMAVDEELQTLSEEAREERAQAYVHLVRINSQLSGDPELDAIVHALDGGFVAPAPGGDLIRTPDILPTGRNLHGFDPFRIPSAFAVRDGAGQAAQLLARHQQETGALPKSIAIVLWGTDNIKNEGGPLAQALALMGATPRFDSYGRLCGAALIPLEELRRPRIDVVMTLSGIFRDLLPLQTSMLAEAAYLAASAEDEPLEANYVRANALAWQREHGGDLETAALRVFSNADGAYGSNVNQMIDSSCWDEEDELADAYAQRKCFAYGVGGKPVKQSALLAGVLGNVELAYQNLESVELGVTTVDHYFDTLGGIGRAVLRERGDEVPVYIGDQTCGKSVVRTLNEQVALEARTRMLNPKWYEGMLKHGYEGVRQIEASITNTLGWSATTGQVAPWVYDRLSETFVLDDEMRKRLAELNPAASLKVANRLLEAHERDYWSPDEETLEALRRAGEELEDRLEGVTAEGVAAA